MNNPHLDRLVSVVSGQLAKLPVGCLDCERQAIVAGAITTALAHTFATMPIPPDDMASLDGLTAYAEATLEWRARMGYPAEYDGPVGPLQA